MQVYHPTGGKGRISSGFGWRTLSGKQQFHPGIDIAAPIGTPVYAMLDGQVIYQGNRDPKGYGLQIILRHGDSLYTQYGHLSLIEVAEGQTVKGGEQIGLVGNTGGSTGPHLHFEVRTDLKSPPTRINPKDVLDGKTDIKALIGTWTMGKVLPALAVVATVLLAAELL